MSARWQVPLVYSCSGCSNAAQMANPLALKFDRLDPAEMSCIAGVGADMPHLLKMAQSGRPIVALDGGPLDCVKSHLARDGLEADLHHVLSAHGGRKRCHANFDTQRAEAQLAKILARVRALGDTREVPTQFASPDLGADETRRDRS